MCQAFFVKISQIVNKFLLFHCYQQIVIPGQYNEINGTRGRIQSPPLGRDESYKWRIVVSPGNVIFLYVKEYIQGLQVISEMFY